ncbi:hypothetical protein GS506_12695 [Rhodococcus hoagii]|nr:hypothetical protein [Prescottella equi]
MSPSAMVASARKVVRGRTVDVTRLTHWLGAVLGVREIRSRPALFVCGVRRTA